MFCFYGTKIQYGSLFTEECIGLHCYKVIKVFVLHCQNLKGLFSLQINNDSHI